MSTDPNPLRPVSVSGAPAPGGAPAAASHGRRELGLSSLAPPLRWLSNVLVLAGGDVASLAVAFAAGQGVGWLRGQEPAVPAWSLLVVILWLSAAAIASLLPVVFAVAVSIAYLTRWRVDLARVEVGVALAVAAVVLPYARTKLKYLLIRWGVWGMPTVVQGTRSAVEVTLAALRKEPGLGYAPVAAVISGGESGASILGVPVVDAASELAESATAAIIATPDAAGRLSGPLQGPMGRYRRVLVVQQQRQGAPSLWVEPRDLGGLLGLEVTQHLADPWARALKRLFELSLVVSSAPLWVPFVAALALVVRLVDGAPALFAQDRVGGDGSPFRMWKLRTMRPDADRELQRRLDADDRLRAEWQASFKLREDPRVTPLGRVLRRFSLDELPQLWNVLRGDMSLVGPRPLPAYHHVELSDESKALRSTVRPGMTGLWQVSGRADAPLGELESTDAYYVRNWSVWLDLVILVRTWRAITSRAGAY